ncbi:pimeloyl-ACP methyl ester carboxylesterase [Kitasatospora sp. MAA4]|nr:alpha/beta hydrolase [Kitasatospora sp. MAA4]MDH6136502.1 pimeloyl-ACP methyl ester carboxylesterase [Kitasatospora sp. MAA4]
MLPVPPDAFDGWHERDARLAVGSAVWSDPTLSGSELVRAAAVAEAPADVWRPQALPDYQRRLESIHFTAEWLRPWRAGVLPSARPDAAAERLTAFGIPLLLLHGRQDMTFPAHLAEDAERLIPSARAVVLDDAGHMAHLDQPGPWLGAITDFLRDLGAVAGRMA